MGAAEDWAYLESLPRVTLAQRIAYWDLRHALEDTPAQAHPWARRVRPYIDPVRPDTVALAGPHWPYI